jgi:hypothetical protein
MHYKSLYEKLQQWFEVQNPGTDHAEFVIPEARFARVLSPTLE